VYHELRKLAASRLVQEQPGQTLQATALVHEAMRRILIEQARHKLSQRRGGGRQREDFEQVALAAPEPSFDVLAVSDALDRFEQVDPLKAQLVKLRYFAGMTIPEAAEVLGISTTTADRYWAYARAWLHAELKK
jgi:RNA polymerase sigma factor (TIGR02999 family)